LKVSADGERFAVALVDAATPGWDGLRLAEMIQTEPMIAGIPIVLMTFTAPGEDAGHLRTLGVAACLTKPVRYSELLDALRRVLDRHGDRPAESTTPIRRGASPLVDPRVSHDVRVLVADDNFVNQKVAARMLEDMGCTVVVADNGRKALEAFESGDFTVVLMDIQMPQMGGIEALEAIRRLESGTGRHTPVLAVTAHNIKGDRESFLTAGFDGYLAKPVSQFELRQALAALKRK
jgi:CheY-like chemotaxis protein